MGPVGHSLEREKRVFPKLAKNIEFAHFVWCSMYMLLRCIMVSGSVSLNGRSKGLSVSGVTSASEV
jgi:hypothetical protein